MTYSKISLFVEKIAPVGIVPFAGITAGLVSSNFFGHSIRLSNSVSYCTLIAGLSFIGETAVKKYVPKFGKKIEQNLATDILFKANFLAASTCFVGVSSTLIDRSIPSLQTFALFGATTAAFYMVAFLVKKIGTAYFSSLRKNHPSKNSQNTFESQSVKKQIEDEKKQIQKPIQTTEEKSLVDRLFEQSEEMSKLPNLVQTDPQIDLLKAKSEEGIDSIRKQLENNANLLEAKIIQKTKEDLVNSDEVEKLILEHWKRHSLN